MVFSRWRLPLVLAAACLVHGIALADDDVLEGKDDLAGSGEHDHNYDHGSGSGESSGEDEPDHYHDYHDLPMNLSAEAPVSGWAYGCPYPTSGGDFDAGIQLVGDSTCNQGGLGCYADVCRFCKFRETNKSSHLVTCDSLGYDIHVPVVVTQLPPPNPDTDCPYNVSSGDFAVGVQLVGDPSCVDGGIGCYQDVCRFCKFQETPQSTNWRNCSEFGYPHTPAPTFAPLVIDDLDGGVWDGSTGCAYAVSPGDFAVGVQLVGDASCATGGIGCFGTDCRFCQFRPTLQSKHMLTCSSLGYPRPAQPIAAPADITDPITGCPFPVSSGDFAAGVQLVGDPTCAKGGLGCFKDVCRFCKFKESPQSTNFVPCSDFNYPPEAPPVIQQAEINDPPVDYGTGCPFPVSSGDYAVGIQLVGDASCAKGGGVGCFQDVCRFCKFEETPQSTHMVACSTLGWPRTVAPVAQPADVTEAPATECPYAVSSGDYAVGIQLVGDASCVTGGLGCYKNVCRFCQFQETPNSKHFVNCSDLGYPHNGATFSPSSLDEPTSTNCPYPASSGDVAAGIQLVGDSACAHGGLGCFKDVCRFCKVWSTPQSSGYASCEDLGYYFGSPADTVVPEPPSTGPSTKCPFPASDGDLAAGVMLVGDASCDKGGIGCFQNVCRFCQFVPTPQSNQFVTCASLGYNYPLPPIPTMPAPTSPPPPPTTPPPTTAPPPTPAPTAAPCPYAVSDGDFAVGIQLVGDATCASGGLGCYANVCRFCKFKETPQSANWLPCSNFYPPVPTTAVVVTETPAPTAPPPPPPPPIANMTCDTPLSQGDHDAGVGLVTDYSCLISGLGCIKGSVCRFCQVWATEKSSHLDSCHSYGAILPTPDTTQPSVGPSQAPGVVVPSEAPAATSQALPPLGQTPVAGSQNPSVVAPEPPVVAPGAPAVAPAPAVDTSAPPAVAPIPPVVAPVEPAPGGDTVAPVTSQTPSDVAPVAPAASAAPVDPNSQAPPVAITSQTPPAAGQPSVDPSQVPVVATVPSVVAPSPSDATQAPAVAAPAVVPVPATQPSADPTSVAPSQDPSTAPVVAPPPLRAAAKERASKSSAGTLNKLFENDAFKVLVSIAACVGVVALVALVAIGAKRALPRRKLRMPVVDEVETKDMPVVDDEEEEAKEEEPETLAPATPTGVLEDQV